MVCPEYKNGQCGVHDSSYVLTPQQIANYCEFPGNEYLACPEHEKFTQLSRAKPSSLETSARDGVGALSQPKGTISI